MNGLWMVYEWFMNGKKCYSSNGNPMAQGGQGETARWGLGCIFFCGKNGGIYLLTIHGCII